MPTLSHSLLGQVGELIDEYGLSNVLRAVYQYADGYESFRHILGGLDQAIEFAEIDEESSR